MLLSKKTTIQLNSDEANIVGHMCYAAYKLWNICNYERRNYKELGDTTYPDWYYQKSHHKDNMWFKSLPSQTAQEVCKLVDKSWKSFYALQKSGGIKNPRPPRFKHDGMVITYMQHALVHHKELGRVRLSLPKQLKQYMKDIYDVETQYLFISNPIFMQVGEIKQIKLYPPKDGSCKVIVVYEQEACELLANNGHVLSIDLGLHNLMTCYDSYGKSFIVGRKYLEITSRYDREIARVQSQWAKCQASKSIKYPKPSKHVLRLYEKKKNSVYDYLHKVTRYIVEYCKKQQINTMVIGDIKHIREHVNLGSKTNQKLHSLPYEKLYGLLAYKLRMAGITLQKQEESYSSQCSPTSIAVSKRHATKSKRKHRGLYVEQDAIYNADSVGAYNIMRKYKDKQKQGYYMPVSGLSNPKVIKVAV
ncbi:MAG: transposase [Lachnospiraceae bacterium]